MYFVTKSNIDKTAENYREEIKKLLMEHPGYKVSPSKEDIDKDIDKEIAKYAKYKLYRICLVNE